MFVLMSLTLGCASVVFGQGIPPGSPHSDQAGGLSAAERAEGWTMLFDGSSTDHWRGFKQESFPEKGWVIEHGTLRHVAGKGGGDIITRDQYGDFDFRFEWKVAPGANSGVMYRVGEDDAPTWRTGPEYQVLDNAGHHDGKNVKTSAGALYALIAAYRDVTKPAGQWNRARIIIKAGHVEHWTNGVKVLEYEWAGDDVKKLIADSKFAAMPKFMTKDKGFIALQDHGDDVWYRNIRIRDLSDAKEVVLFNGRDLTGWTAYLNGDESMEDVWSVHDGVMLCGGRPAGYIRTKADYTNYILRLEWRFPGEPGNSGVLLRMIGEDKVWPRSVEAQLQSGSAGDFWNIDEFPMKVDPARTNGRNTKKTAFAENPVGEWNEYEITVYKGDVVLVVNGVEVNRAWDVLETPGKICLQSEGAPIEFRKIRLTPLD